jgi:hypothetical protein
MYEYVYEYVCTGGWGTERGGYSVCRVGVIALPSLQATGQRINIHPTDCSDNRAQHFGAFKYPRDGTALLRLDASALSTVQCNDSIN